MSVQQINLEITQDFVFNLFKTQATEQATDWLHEKIHNINAGGSDKDLYLAFSAAPRFTGKHVLQLHSEDLKKAEVIRPGFNPAN